MGTTPGGRPVAGSTAAWACAPVVAAVDGFWVGCGIVGDVARSASSLGAWVDGMDGACGVLCAHVHGPNTALEEPGGGPGPVGVAAAIGWLVCWLLLAGAGRCAARSALVRSALVRAPNPLPPWQAGPQSPAPDEVLRAGGLESRDSPGEARPYGGSAELGGGGRAQGFIIELPGDSCQRRDLPLAEPTAVRFLWHQSACN